MVATLLIGYLDSFGGVRVLVAAGCLLQPLPPNPVSTEQ